MLFEKRPEFRRPTVRPYRETIWTRLAVGALTGLRTVGLGIFLLVTLVFSALSGGDLPSNRKEWWHFLLLLLLCIAVTIGVEAVVHHS